MYEANFIDVIGHLEAFNSVYEHEKWDNLFKGVYLENGPSKMLTS